MVRVITILALLLAAFPAFAADGLSKADKIALGKSIFENRCIICHNNTHVRKVGPGLEGVYGRQAESGIGILNDELLHRWLKDPRSVKPSTVMPKYGPVQDDTIRGAVIEFLKTL